MPKSKATKPKLVIKPIVKTHRSPNGTPKPAAKISELPPKLSAPLPPPPPPGQVDDRQVRREACNKAIEEACQKYNCVLCVTSLNIMTGKILPQVEVIAR